MHEPFVIDEPVRQTIDAGWSTKKKAIVSTLSIAVSAGALSAGLVVMGSGGPPPKPENAEEAIAYLQSGKYEKLDANRRREYARDAASLFFELSEEERREMLQDEELREQLGDFRRDVFDDMVLRWARGEEIDMPFGPGGPPRRERGEEGEEDERPQFDRAAMQERIRDRIQEQVSSGDAQMSGLRGEMFRSRMGGGGRPGRGGGPRGGN
ncbi:MAG: hypothetical protein AAGB51_02500 [Planctomycetota bacterium]